MSIHEAMGQLAEQLRSLAEWVGGSNAFVFDAWGVIWCSARITFGREQELLYAQVTEVIESQNPPLHRGGKLDRIARHDEASMYCVSFAASYVLGVWIPVDANEVSMRRLVRDAMPVIESLTLALPPPDGSGGFSGAQHA